VNPARLVFVDSTGALGGWVLSRDVATIDEDGGRAEAARVDWSVGIANEVLGLVRCSRLDRY
jgi:hypothetical protein